MFDKAKYLTSGIDATISLAAQTAMWQMIEVAQIKTQLDYLQIFKLTPGKLDGKPVQIIEHSQEVPPFHQTAAFSCSNPVMAKIYCIDDGDHATMCFPEER